MTVAAAQAPTTGIEAAFPAASNMTVSKSSGSAPASATQAAFPELLGQMVDSEIENRPSSQRGAAPGAKATTTLGAGASKKAAGERNRAASRVTTSEPGRIPVAPDPASDRTQYSSLLLQGGALSLAASGEPFSETGGTGGDAASDGCRATVVGADGEAALIRTQAGQPTGTPGAVVEVGQTLAGIRALAGGEQRSNPITEAAGGSAVQPTDVALGIGWSRTACAEQELKPPGPLAAAGAALSATEDAGARAARHEPTAAVLSSQVPASGLTGTVTASPGDRMSRAGREQAAATQKTAETQPPERRAADPIVAAQAAYTVAAEAADTASPVAPFSAGSEGRAFEPARGAGDGSDATAAGSAGSPDGDGLATQGTLAFQALLVPVPASDPQRAGQGSGKPAMTSMAGSRPSTPPAV